MGDAAGPRRATMPSLQDHELYRRILGIEAPWYVDWAEPSSRFTALFEALAIEWLKAAS